jgi:hypothetical protein
MEALMMLNDIGLSNSSGVGPRNGVGMGVRLSVGADIGTNDGSDVGTSDVAGVGAEVTVRTLVPVLEMTLERKARTVSHNHIESLSLPE